MPDQFADEVAGARLSDLEVWRLIQVGVELGNSIAFNAPVVGATIRRLYHILH